MLHFLLAFAADLVTLPEAGDFLSMVLMTPKPLSASCPTWQKGMKEEQRMRFLERGTKGNAPEAVIPQREAARLSSCGWVRFLTHPPRRALREGLQTEGFAKDHLHDGYITCLQGPRVVPPLLVLALVNLFP